MARKSPIGIIVLDDVENKIDFLSGQDPSEQDPKKAKLKAGRNEWVVWNIENYFTSPGKIEVTLCFPWLEDADGAPFKKNKFAKKVDNRDGGGPGVASIRAKVENDATIGKDYKYTITADANDLAPLDPRLEIDDGRK